MQEQNDRPQQAAGVAVNAAGNHVNADVNPEIAVNPRVLSDNPHTVHQSARNVQGGKTKNKNISCCLL